MRPGQPALDHLPQVQQQMPPIRDLDRPRRPERDTAGVFGRAVAGDGANPAVAPKPGQRASGRSGPAAGRRRDASPGRREWSRRSRPCVGPSRRHPGCEGLDTAAEAGGAPGAAPCRRSPACRAAAASARPPRRPGRRRPDPAPRPGDAYDAHAAQSAQAAARQRSAANRRDYGSTGVSPPTRDEPRARGRADRQAAAECGCGPLGSARHSLGSARCVVAPRHGSGCNWDPRRSPLGSGTPAGNAGRSFQTI